MAPLASVKVVRSGISPSSGSAFASSMAVVTSFDGQPHADGKGEQQTGDQHPSQQGAEHQTSKTAHRTH